MVIGRPDVATLGCDGPLARRGRPQVRQGCASPWRGGGGALPRGEEEERTTWASKPAEPPREPRGERGPQATLWRRIPAGGGGTKAWVSQPTAPPGSGNRGSVPLPHCPPSPAAAIAAATMPKRKKQNQQQPPPPPPQPARWDRDEPGDDDDDEEEDMVSEEDEEEEEDGDAEETQDSEDDEEDDMEEDDDDSDYPEEMEDDDDDASYCTESSFRSHSTYSSTPGVLSSAWMASLCPLLWHLRRLWSPVFFHAVLQTAVALLRIKILFSDFLSQPIFTPLPEREGIGQDPRSDCFR
ncbi:protein phosphatase 1G-like [Cricetulus griseus]|uniref:protein phosphatase 1G-like n=1 Tax=Cricetulus griseus TaxID=10029 RepID=UPI0015C401FA|nr:protein phosphatase 1G-like [Cricetulus griseus]